MAPRTSKHPVVTIFAAQARGIEDAVLTLLGEQEMDPAEVTETGTPVWGRLDRLEANTRAHAPKRVGAVATFRFAPTRRSENELPWSALAAI